MQLATFLPIYKLSKYNDINKKEEQQNTNVLNSMGLLEGCDDSNLTGDKLVDNKLSESGTKLNKLDGKLDSKTESIIRIECRTSSSTSSSDE